MADPEGDASSRRLREKEEEEEYRRSLQEKADFYSPVAKAKRSRDQQKFDWDIRARKHAAAVRKKAEDEEERRRAAEAGMHGEISSKTAPTSSSATKRHRKR